ncbi:DUF3040 domain-containing protein [Actinoplanes sp. NBRC 103695]|uniref:DUF3040 domain-containing protein n=1 Tax=Actinoplanes sp. NBRC 103695 TaxID=3032202 RepID=UPI0024A090D2|nr:DUF3040 domain-containing protein [Actinoplanes sp. NBRC 103695]GLY96195.1 hypothetical protein Acsp02_34500 [Actinoplanes sp. NBRC 103695]
MLSKEDSRRLAQLERQLRRDDPEFCDRMSAGGRTARRRLPVSLILVAVAVWVAALILAVSGWWIAAGIAAACATMIVATLAYRGRRPVRTRPPEPEPLPPAW